MPGGANDPEGFWELLRSGRDPMREVPPERWDLSALYDPNPGTPGKMYVRQCGFVVGRRQGPRRKTGLWSSPGQAPCRS